MSKSSGGAGRGGLAFGRTDLNGRVYISQNTKVGQPKPIGYINQGMFKNWNIRNLAGKTVASGDTLREAKARAGQITYRLTPPRG